MQTWKLAIMPLLLLLLIPTVPGQEEQHSVLLPPNQIKAVSNWYSKDRSETYEGSWQPTKADLDSLEKSLPQISGLKIHRWDSRIHIERPEKYFRQYVAVKVVGQNRIFVNAFCDEKPPPNWREHLFVVMDGDICFWQALYDPFTHQFTNLRINSRA